MAVSTVPITAVLSYSFDVKEYDFDNQIEANKKVGKVTEDNYFTTIFFLALKKTNEIYYY